MATTAFGIIVVILGLIGWVGQALVVFHPPTAVALGVFEAPDEIDPSMYLFERFSQGIMDVLLMWILPAAALLMILGHPAWPLLALIGGGLYLYFPGVFMITRVVLKRHDRAVGKPSSLVTAYVLGWLWIASAIVMIGLATRELYLQ